MEKTVFKKWEQDNKTKVSYSKKRISEKKQQQVGLGELVERNFIAAALNVSNEQVTITKTPKSMDYMFGADFKIQYKRTGMAIDGYSVYCDITLNPNKKDVIMYRENAFSMANGCTVSIGYKKECSQFVYRKPVLVFVIHTDYKVVEFEEGDVLAMLYAAIQPTKYISDVLTYKYNDVLVRGCKRASTKVIFKHKHIG